MTRTFLALDLSPELQTFLGRAIARGTHLLPAARWVEPTSLHVTLAFLGELSDEQLAQAIEAGEAAARQVSPFSYRLTGLGTFGPASAPRVIWMGLEDASGRMRALQQTLMRELKARGFPPEERPFSPHLTLARLKRPLSREEQQALQRLLYEIRVPASLPQHTVETLDVMKSELSRAGARYSYLHRAHLARPHDEK
ncbi:RNA 2',3'-cyclic phosphodiesterase [Thermogemmatispora sp.]|uniref:RNA 2',3'-cyclic phosphodiesterase n=1 Tax=Thermogemmatispora sp. TaxID=1968838 RepID=UPI002ACBDFA0|nr:RNA 2',3'-cyclic phosphodiesterase [Thermogemmatispora sp.]